MFFREESLPRDSEISYVLGRTLSLFPRLFITRYVSPELFRSLFSSFSVSLIFRCFCDISQGHGIVIKSRGRAGQMFDHATQECVERL